MVRTQMMATKNRKRTRGKGRRQICCPESPRPLDQVKKDIVINCRSATDTICRPGVADINTYLAVMRLEDVVRPAGLAVRWRPYNPRTLFQEMNVFPFPDGAPKTKHMWRDIERRASAYGHPVRLPVPHPLKDSAIANRVALLGMREGWGPAFVRTAYRRWFHFGEENGGEPNIRAALETSGQNYECVMEIANSSETHRELELETDEARRLGLFGSPIFVVDDEMFWGNDRLEDAVSWYRHGRVAV
jgi:2-hydroxychromene-2-carboxylate isomerase